MLSSHGDSGGGPRRPRPAQGGQEPRGGAAAAPRRHLGSGSQSSGAGACPASLLRVLRQVLRLLVGSGIAG